LATTIAANSVALGTDTTGNYVATVAGTNNEIEVSGSGSESATITIGLPDNVTIGNDLTVTGNLIVSGSTAYINTTELLVEDNLVTLNSGTTGSPTLNAGIEIERGTSANTSIRWNESTDVWEFTNDGTNYYTIKDFDTALGTKTTDNLAQGSTNLYFTDERAQDAISTAIAAGTQTNITVSYNDSTNSFSFISVDPGVTSLLGTADEVTVSASAGAVTLSLPATINANTTGTAAALTTARTIELTGDVTGTLSFDGSSSASMATTIAANSVALGTDTSGNYVATAAAGTGIEVSGSGSETAALTITNTGVTSLAGTADEVTVSASAGAVTLSLPATINANTTGTAAALTTARTIELTGDVTGTVSFDGSASASLATTIAANSVALGTDTTGNYVATATAGSGIEVSGSGSETAALTITNTGVTSLAGTADEVTVSASAGAVTLSLPATINANTTGTAAALTTARTIELTGDVTGTVSFDGSASASMVTTVVNGGGGGVTSLLGTVNQVAVSASTGAVTLSLPANVDLTGVPTAPTAAPGTNTTQLATTAFVTSAVAAGGGSSGASTIHPMFIIGGV
jgi:cytoskeletal protein CcmA (bactofilin family)